MARGLAAEIAKFASVGGLAFIVDMGVFNLLAFDGMPLDHKPTTAKIISALVATVLSWVLNRQWTFRSSATASRGREFATFALVNLAGIGVAAAVLWITVYLMGFDSVLAKNLASVVGIGLGTILRYFGYKLLVFRAGDEELRDREALTAAVDGAPQPPESPAEAPGPDPVARAPR